ncbi:class I SAM-dependent methyltransferase [Georgenia alba]|uniref:Class I SAM-dependent methyltransferase n=1 Tax=Georgenia alba TaxID=2233858 RepID=A0ABW2Q257_9MICO
MSAHHGHEHRPGLLHRLHRRFHRTGEMGVDGEVYDRTSGRLNGRLYRRAAADVAQVAQEVAPDGAAVLDVGAGTGRLLAALADVLPGARITGVDVAETMVEVARRRTATLERVTVDAGDVGELPYPDAQFDVVVSTLSMHHWPDQAAAVAEVARVLRPGGALLVFDFARVDASALAAAARDGGPFAGAAPDRTRLPLLRFFPVPRLARYTLHRA